MTTINTPTGGDDKLNSIMEKRNELSDKEQSELLAMFQQDKEVKRLEGLRGDRDGILNALKENSKYIKIEKNVEVMGYKGKKVYINLPKVGNFEGFKFDYFVSDDYVTKKDFEVKPELEKKSYSMNDIPKLLKATNGFMAALGCETGGDMEYENELKNWGSKARKCLRDITFLDDFYWLGDKDVAGRNGSHVILNCIEESYEFTLNNHDYISHLFLRLSD